jgi:arsenate reductase
MKTHHREIQIYYNPESNYHRKTLAYAKSMARHVKSYAFHQTPSTETSWQQIIKALDLEDPKVLLNKADPYYQEHLRGRDFSEACWIKIIQKNTHLIKFPIALRGNRAIVCQRPKDIYKLIEEKATV